MVYVFTYLNGGDTAYVVRPSVFELDHVRGVFVIFGPENLTQKDLAGFVPRAYFYNEFRRMCLWHT